MLSFSPDHFIDDGDVGLDDFDDDIGDIFTDVNVDWGAVIMVAVHSNGGFHGLKKRFLIDACEDEAGVVERFGTLCGCADADGREGMTDRGEERGFFGQRARVRNNGGSVHLQAVVVMEAERIMLNHTSVEIEA